MKFFSEARKKKIKIDFKRFKTLKSRFWVKTKSLIRFLFRVHELVWFKSYQEQNSNNHKLVRKFKIISHEKHYHLQTLLNPIGQYKKSISRESSWFRQSESPNFVLIPPRKPFLGKCFHYQQRHVTVLITHLSRSMIKNIGFKIQYRFHFTGKLMVGYHSVTVSL